MPSAEQMAALRRENEELKQSLRNMQEQIANVRAAVDEVEHVVYALSHDFRTPLRTMASYAQLLERQCPLDEEAREMTSFIIKGVNDMKVLIEDVLKYSRIKNSPALLAVPLATIVQWASLALQAQVREAGAEIIAVDLPEVVINESQFVQLFEQLFSNALKFRSSDPLKIEVTAEETEDGHVISVKDNGIGVAPAYHEMVFAPFRRLQGKEVSGTGLGLAICRKIVRAHGGRIWVESDGTHGSAFRFTVPS